MNFGPKGGILILVDNDPLGCCDQSNEGSNFILSSLEVGLRVAQTKAFFVKLSEITDFGLLQQSQSRARLISFDLGH